MATVIKGQDGQKLQGTDGRPVNVWVVDDNPEFRDVLKRTLSNDPGLHCSHQFSSAPLMLAALQSLPLPDVILLDVQMPEMTGLEALPRLRQLAPATAVLMLSTFLDIEWRQQALAAGARGYFRKTEPVANLLAAIHAAPTSPPAASATTSPRV